ncbi:MAG: PDZ domain-containing protein [Alphaproteobacteria bacterium]|nr:PDZ domain-containing protein [Alphaproteobacteria bacterium]
MFADAYGHIQDRYIEPVAIGPLAMAGLKQLLATQNDPSLRLQVVGTKVVLMAQGAKLAEFARPDRHDAKGWARVTADAIERAAAVEPGLRAEPAEAIYQEVFDGALALLDPFSRYASAEAAAQQRAAREGFDGLGISIQTVDGVTRVVEVMEGTPAQGGGLEVGDVITHVDGHPLAGLDSTAVIERLRGPAGSLAVLDLRRPVPGQPRPPPRILQVKVRRAHVVPVTVHTRLDGNLAVIRISSFNRNTTRDLERQYRQLPIGRVRGLILDLRDNPGGLLDQAVLTADLFLDSGVVISTFGRHPAASSVFIADRHRIAAGLPIVLLTNGGSASSAEMLAASLQDRGRAVVVGTVTHGKGSVQNLARLPNGGELVITWSRLHAPSGYILDGLGVLPTVCTAAANKNGNAEPIAARLDDYAMQAPRWQRYNHVDPALAATLRAACPAGPADEARDMELAKNLLRHPALYRRALRPAPGTTAAGTASHATL